MSRGPEEDTQVSHDKHISPGLDPRKVPRRKACQSHIAGGAGGNSSSVTLVESLGSLCIWTYGFGYITIGGSISFLIFLWSNDGTGSIWRQIAMAGWMPRCISLTSSILRVTIAVQAACATSILAAILMQGFHIHILAVPALSMMRWENSGPFALARLLWPRFTSHSFIMIWVIILTLNTFMSQILSTLLLTDVGQSAIVSTFNVSNLPSDVDSATLPIYYYRADDIGSSLVLQPLTFPTMAEYHKALPEQENGFYDTGPAFRGFLPMSNQSQRSTLYSFNGTSAVLDARVICMRPELKFSVSPVGETVNAVPDALQLTGTVGFPNTTNPYYEYSAETYDFTCVLTYSQRNFLGGDEELEWPLSVCHLGYSFGGLGPNKLYSGLPGHTSNFLVFNASGDLSSWYAVSAHPWWKEQTLEESADSEWKVFTSDVRNITEGLSDALLSVSLCFTPTKTCMMNISASGGVQHTEARIAWVASNQTYNTEEVRRSLGATAANESISQRGHLQIDEMHANLTLFTAEQFSSCYRKAFFRLLEDLIGVSEPFKSTFFCALCSRNYRFTSNTTSIVHPVFSALFNDITRLTRHPALALQAVLTVVSGMTYSDQSSTFTITAPALVKQHVAVLAPVQWVGLTIVLAISAIHCILVTTILVVYARSQKRSMIGSAWSALGQIVQGPVMREWIQDCTLDDDNTMSDKLKAAGEDKTLVGIAFVNGTKEVEIRRRQRKGG